MTVFGISDYGSFCAAIVLFLALPGPGTLALLTSTAHGGLRAGAAATAGIIVGDQVLLWMAVGGLAALLAAHPVAFKVIQHVGALYVVWLGARLIFARRDGSTPVFQMLPHHHFRQTTLITLLNPKAIVFYLAFFPLFIDPNTHRGLETFGAMALTIAAITAVYCLSLCAFAQAVTARVRAHRQLASTLQRLAGVCLVAFGIRLSTG